MEFVQLTDAQREEFEENGYLIFRSVLDKGNDKSLDGGRRPAHGIV